MNAGWLEESRNEYLAIAARGEREAVLACVAGTLERLFPEAGPQALVDPWIQALDRELQDGCAELVAATESRLLTGACADAARSRAASRAPSSQPRRRQWGALLGALAVASVAAIAGAGSATASELQTLTAATFIRSDEPQPPREAGQSLTLPDPWDLRHKDISGYAWYFVDWPLAMPPKDLQAVYLTAITLPAHVFVNGLSVGLTGSLAGRRPRAWEQSQLFEVPVDALHAGTNRIAVRVHAFRAGAGGLGPIVVGDHASVVELQMRDLMAHTVGPAIVSVIMVVVGLAIVVLWLRRHDTSYLLFGLAAILWGLHTAATLVPEPPLPQPHWMIWWHATYMLFVVLLCLFCMRFAGADWRAYRRFAVAFVIVVVPVLYAANAVGWARRGNGIRPARGIALVIVALGAVARYALRMRNAESVLLLATGAIATAFAVHDWMADQDPLAIRPLWLVPYSAFAFLVLFSWILIDRFVRALDETERLNADLERHIAAKSASLEFQLAQTQRAMEDAETANRAKSRFLAAASHDLRQPLHALGLFAAALTDHTHDAGGADLVHRIRRRSHRSRRCCPRCSTFRSSTPEQSWPNRKASSSTISSSASATTSCLKHSRRQLRLAIVPTRLVVHSDPALLERILRNLVANALRYTERGGVVVGARRRGDRVAIEVRDSGIGHRCRRARTHIRRVLPDRQSRARSRAGARPGACDRPAPSGPHGRRGRGGVASRARVRIQGSRQGGRPEGAGKRAPAGAEAPGSMQGRCVVIVDDEPSVRDSTQELLSSWGCTVVAARDPADAIAALDGRIPSVLLVDYRLRGGQDGLAAIAWLRTALSRDVPAVLVSGESSAEELARIKASGFLLLHKPVPPAKLRSALAYLLASDSTGFARKPEE